MIKPTLRYEQELWEAGYRRVAGLDEVGLGACCACLVAAAVVLGPEIDLTGLEEVRDSKTLSARQRERLAPLIREKALAYGLGAASPAEIARLNLRRAAALAMKRALRRVGQSDYLLVDGLPIKELGPNQTAIVKGDAHSLSIACASILAKVCRDRLLVRLDERYPGYGWKENVGYPTREHKLALQNLGVTPHHRLNYAPVQAVLLKPEKLLADSSQNSSLEE